MKKLLVGLALISSFSALAKDPIYTNCEITKSSDSYIGFLDSSVTEYTFHLSGFKEYEGVARRLDLKEKTFSFNEKYEGTEKVFDRYYRTKNKLMEHANRVCSDVTDLTKY